jgi:hypothetical protein
MRVGLGKKTMFGAIGTLVAIGIGLAVIGVVGIVGWEYSNSDQFCANMCHAVHPEESIVHRESSHARVRCVECHMGRLSTLHMMGLKPTHVNELWGMIVGYERPLASHTLRPARDNCESCHWPSAVHRDSVALKKRYQTDEPSSEVTTRLLLHTAFGIIREHGAKGIHWHIENEVLFKTPVVQQREIPWVQVRAADGTTTTYVDPTSKVSEEELAGIEPRRMECYDCHNAVGHPFRSPSDVVDEAIATGRLDRSLPFTKARAEEIIIAAGDLSGPRAEREKKVNELISASTAQTKVRPEDLAKNRAFEDEMRRILLTTSFESPGVTWKSFPNHAGHNEFPGCFRCHDGKHLNEKGEAIRLQCTLCHDLPQVRLESGKGSVPSTVAAGLTPPPSHEDPNFMHDHRLKLDDTCQMCHGKIDFGREGGSFCSNPACHGRTYPSVNLNVDFTPPASTVPPVIAPAKAQEPKATPKASAKSAK